MRKIVTAAAVAACMGAITLAVAADPVDREPQARAYVNFDFDRHDGAAPGRFFYGLRLDHDTRLSDDGAPLAPIAQLQFGRQGFADARLNGVPFLRRQVRLDQDEGGDASEGGDEGGNGAGATQFSAMDWGLLAAGALGLGFIVTEVADNEESPDPRPGGTTTGGTTGGTCVPGTPLCLPLDGGPGTGVDNTDPAYQDWLDGGTGQMGDLIAQ